MLPVLFVSPPYTAVIECVATVNVVVANVATPEPFNVPVPIVVAPSLNVTVPVGVIGSREHRCRKRDRLPESDGFRLEVSVVLEPV